MTLKHRTTHHAAHWAQSKVTTAIALHCLRAMHFKSTQIELYFQVYKNISVLSCPTVMDSLWPCGFFDSTPRAVLFLPNPGHHPWSDDAVPFTSRWWCLQQYTYSRRIPLWNIQHDKCLCKFFNRWYRIANKYPILCCVWQLPVYAHCMVAQKRNTRFSN